MVYSADDCPRTERKTDQVASGPAPHKKGFVRESLLWDIALVQCKDLSLLLV